MTGTWLNAANMYDGNDTTLCQEGVTGATLNEIRFLFSGLAAALPAGVSITEIQFRRKVDHATAGITYTMRLYSGASVVESIADAITEAASFPTIDTNTDSLTSWDLSGIDFEAADFAVGFLLSSGGISSARWREIEFNFVGEEPDPEIEIPLLSAEVVTLAEGNDFSLEPGLYLRVIFAIEDVYEFSQPLPAAYAGAISVSSGAVEELPIGDEGFGSSVATYVYDTHWGFQLHYAITNPPDPSFTFSLSESAITWTNDAVAPTQDYFSAAVVDEPVPWESPITKGVDWQGACGVARRITGVLAGGCRMWGVGDSLLSSAYSSTDATNTSLNYGIVNNFDVDWSGFVCTVLSQGDAWSHNASFGSGTNYDPRPGAAAKVLPDSLATDLIPIPAAYVEWGSNVADSTFLFQYYFTAANMAARYVGGDWSAQAVDARVRLAYLQHAAGGTCNARGVRPYPSGNEDVHDLETDGATLLTYDDFELATDGTDTQPGVLAYTKTGYDENTKNLILVAARIYLPSLEGFEFLPGGIGGASCADHAGTTIYSDASLAALITATESNAFMICLGANAGLGGSKAIYKANFTAVIDRYRAAALAAGQTSPIFVVFAPWYNLQVSDADIDTMTEALFEIADSRTDTLALNLARQLGDMDGAGLLIDNIHTSREGSDAAAAALWRLIDHVSDHCIARIRALATKRRMMDMMRGRNHLIPRGQSFRIANKIEP